MGLDIRVPIGMLFVILGAVLAIYGLLTDAAVYQRSLGYNVNLAWGTVLLLFGAGMWYFGRRGTSAMHPAETSPEGRATEAREHAEGLERE